MKKGDWILVTNTHRGIYFGQLIRNGNQGKTVVLENARHCFYFSAVSGHEGTFGLATHGPGDGSKTGPVVSLMIINDVSTKTLCSDEAIKRWKEATWGK